jgi:hypothetical protein
MVTLTVRKKDGSEVEVKASTLQIPAALHGDHSLTPRQVSISADINPATGAPYTQVGPRPATQISPPPSRRFDGR